MQNYLKLLDKYTFLIFINQLINLAIQSFSEAVYIIIYQMSGQNLDYIIQKQKITLYHGKMQSIIQKSSEGFLINQVEDKFSFEIKMKNKVIIWSIQIQLLQTDFAIFQIFNQDGTVQESISQAFGSLTAIVLFQKNKKNKKITSKVRITLFNSQATNGLVGIKYMLVRGDKGEQKNTNKRDNRQKNPKTKAHESSMYAPQHSPHVVIKKDKEVNKLIFADRITHKEQSYEDKQLKKAIQLSKKQQERKLIGNQIYKPKELQKYKVEPIMEILPRQYNTVDFDKISSVFSFVNSNWLEAQKKMQNEKGVKESERLSSRIQVKHFYNKKVCIDVPAGKRQQLKKDAESMGAKIVLEPEDYCILVTNRVDTERVVRARKLKMVKIVNVQFIPQCKQFGGYLDEKEYYLKL